MSFDLFLVSFHDGKNVAADAPAAKAILDAVKFQHDPRFDSYVIDFDDGSHAEMYAGGLDGAGKEFDGGMIALRGMSEAIGDFIFEFSRAAGCVMFPAIEGACVLVPQDDLAKHLPKDITEKMKVIQIASGAELLAALSGGYDAWRAYRDRIVGESKQ